MLKIISTLLLELSLFLELEHDNIKIKNIINKKSSYMEIEEIKQYLLKKGYKSENIKEALEGEEDA